MSFLLPGGHTNSLLFFFRGGAMSKKSILMLIGDYVEDYEVMVPYQALMMADSVNRVPCHH
jgi:hypothetical protein